MPFPLAHPAAVLPLRRYCPRWLSFPALVIGSLCPDAGYLFAAFHVDHFSHQFLGSIGFCLPLGMALLALFYALRLPLARMLPAAYRQALIPLCQRPRDSLGAIIISLLIGAWTHLLLDSLTHADGWIAQLLPLLRSPVMNVAGRTAKVCHLLWYGCSFAGVVWLFVVFEKWKRLNVSGGAVSRATVAWEAVLVALVVVPVELLHHHVIHLKPGLYLLAALCTLPVVGIVWKVASARNGAASNRTSVEVRTN